jgi:hypothetical protein
VKSITVVIVIVGAGEYAFFLLPTCLPKRRYPGLSLEHIQGILPEMGTGGIQFSLMK